MTVSYYKDDEAEIIYACLGEMAREGILRIWRPVTDQAWEWIPRGSEH
jgi:hypothetical protein